MPYAESDIERLRVLSELVVKKIEDSVKNGDPAQALLWLDVWNQLP